MSFLSERVRRHLNEYGSLAKWLIYSCFIGALVGLVAAAFHHGIHWATLIRDQTPWIILFLPLGGVAIILLYRWCGMEKDRGTNLVLVAVRDAERLKLRTAPLIFLSTILTHLVGGSAGREGAALQLGASLSAYIGRKLRLDEKDGRTVVMCGMAAAFSALFDTPLTAVVFAMEVVTVGRMYYAALVPCLASSLVGYLTSQSLGLHMQDGYPVSDSLELATLPILQAAALGALCAALSILFCKAMHAAPRLYAKYLPDPLLRAAVGGALVLGLTLLAGDQTYNGAGDPAGPAPRLLRGAGHGRHLLRRHQLPSHLHPPGLRALRRSRPDPLRPVHRRVLHAVRLPRPLQRAEDHLLQIPARVGRHEGGVRRSNRKTYIFPLA